ncbi:GTP cyclohydrolase I FolE [candidate division TA06 bacterium]|nr:GTP cyclohydrolase I FolE [candidate division TA06 bacterium]
MKDLIEKLLRDLGEDPNREGLVKTPERVERALRYLTQGYGKDVKEVLNGAIYPVEYDEMVLVRNIDFFSLCEHHILPFFGKCHIAYLPRKTVVGLSKIPRLVDIFARRLQLQERLTTEIAKTLEVVLRPKGVGVVMEAQHLCMMMRGVEKQNTLVTTSALLGRFRTDPKTRAEFLELINHGRNGTTPGESRPHHGGE